MLHLSFAMIFLWQLPYHNLTFQPSYNTFNHPQAVGVLPSKRFHHFPGLCGSSRGLENIPSIMLALY
jgi:hypothetical protein